MPCKDFFGIWYLGQVRDITTGTSCIWPVAYSSMPVGRPLSPRGAPSPQSRLELRNLQIIEARQVAFRSHNTSRCSPPVDITDGASYIWPVAYSPSPPFSRCYPPRHPPARWSPSTPTSSTSTASRPTRAATWQGHRIEGLLLNSRMIQGIFDDLNPETRPRWAYPDTGRWDPERNTREFIAAMPEWRRHGLLALHRQPARRQPRGLFERAALAQLGNRCGGLPPPRVHGPARAHPRPRRLVGHGGDPRHLLLRPGRADLATKPP